MAKTIAYIRTSTDKQDAPVFDIQHEHGMTNMLVQSSELGRSLASSLGKSAVVLMRGHGATIVGSSVK